MRASLDVKKYWEIIAGNLKKRGWSFGWVSAVDSNGRTYRTKVLYVDERKPANLRGSIVSPNFSRGGGRRRWAVGDWRNVGTPNEHPHGHASASHPNPDRAVARTGNEFSSGNSEAKTIKKGKN